MDRARLKLSAAMWKTDVIRRHQSQPMTVFDTI